MNSNADRHWANLNNDGRRVERITKLCDTMITKELDKEDYDNDIILAYIDRLLKAEATKTKIADIVLGITSLRKELERKKYLT